MLTQIQPSSSHCGYKGLSSSGVSLMPAMPQCQEDHQHRDLTRPGYTLCPWVEDFITGPAGQIPRISTRLDLQDRLSTAQVRCGIGRHHYTVSPGLYAVGQPDDQAEVLVTANFKLTFDQLRRAVHGLNLWILVLDTKGVNVWCAAGKGTFGTAELVGRIASSDLARVVTHRRLILPQLGATGVSAHKVRKVSGFKVVYGPVRATDIPAFLSRGRNASAGMREVTFTLAERLVLTPVELQIVLKPALITALVIFLLSGLGPGIFSLDQAWTRGLSGISAMAVGIISGAVVTPVLLPFIPVREFALKGIIIGAAGAMVLIAAVSGTSVASGMALALFTIATSSFLAMNFTGTTPFTSPTGVEKEMKRYIPLQLALLVFSTGAWIYSGF